MERRPATAPESTAAAARPERTCVGCRQGKGKAELVRLVVVDGRVIGNPVGRTAGRSAYLCPDAACWTIAERRRALDRALRASVTADDWRRLREGILK